MFKSLKSKVVASFILLVILPILIGAWIILVQVKATHINHLNIIHSQMTKRVASEFENYVNYNVSQIKQITALYDLPYGKEADISEILMGQIMFNNNFDQIILLNAEGSEITHVHRYRPANLIKHRNYSNQIEFQFPKLNRAVFYGEVTFSEDTGEPVMDVAIDIHDPKTDGISGVMLASLRLKPIWNLLANIAVQPGQSVYILDSEGRLIAHPNPSLVLKNLKYTLPPESVAEGLQGNEVFLKYTKINFGNQFFTVVSEHDIAYAYKLIHYISLIIAIVMLSTLFMTMLLVAVNIKYIVNPINHLSKVAKEIESGNLDRVAKVHNEDEIGAMADAFNKMTAKLKKNNEQLQEFNIGLQKKIKTEIEKTRRIEQILFEQKKFADMGQMINAIAHQWRQPLNNIGLIQQYLCEGVVNGDIPIKEFKEHSGILLEIVQNMSTTIDDFRTFFATNKIKEKFNVISSIREFLKLTGAQLSNSNINYEIQCHGCEAKHIFRGDSLHMECTNKDLEVIGHAGEFKQVVQNIVANAKDAFSKESLKKPFITIIICVNDSCVEIAFRDNAGGIPEKIMPNIFDPYFTTKEEGKGTGIGLYISKIIVDDHFSGRLFARNVDDGAEFVVVIPQANRKLPFDYA